MLGRAIGHLWCVAKHHPTAVKLLAVLLGGFLAYMYWQYGDRPGESLHSRQLRKAEAGDVSAQSALGFAYATGKSADVPQNYGEAVRWYRKAAEQGDANAQAHLGCAYANGEGVEKDEVEAAKWYRMAADQGDRFAFTLLAMCYQYGKGVEEDSIEAYKWFNLAVAHGDSVAAIQRDQIAQDMTPKQIAEGQRRASEFVPKPKTK